MRRTFLDGMRGWAAIMVLLHHALTYFLAQTIPPFQSPFLELLRDGTLAVYIFFVISGFALSIGWFETRDIRVVISLAVRRYPRLAIPILAASTICYGMMRLGLMHNQDAAALLGSGKWLGMHFAFAPSIDSLLRFSLYDVFFHYRGRLSYGTALWTMNTELSGSMIVFALLILFGASKARPLLYLALGYLLAIDNTPLLAFLFGVALADAYRAGWIQTVARARYSWVASAALFVIVALYAPYAHALRPDGEKVLDVPWLDSLAALCAVSAVLLNDRLTRAFETRLSQFLGKISFPLYLTHMFVICSLTAWLYTQAAALGTPGEITSLAILMVTAVVAIFAASLFHPVETVAITLSRRFSDFLLDRVGRRQGRTVAGAIESVG